MKNKLIEDWLFYKQSTLYPSWLKNIILKRSNTLTVYDLENVVGWLNSVESNTIDRYYVRY